MVHWLNLHGPDAEGMGSKVLHSEQCSQIIIFRTSLLLCLPMQGHGFHAWSGKIPQAMELLSPCATTTEACGLQLLKPKHPRVLVPQQENPLQ